MKKGFTIMRGAVAVAGFLAAPLAAFAVATVGSILSTIKGLMDLGIPIIFTLGILYFLYGLAEYVFNSGDADSRKEGRERMIFGVIALFVMASVYGLIGVVASTFGVGQGGTVALPSVPLQ